jgi:phosphoribosylformylglycinamidine (FGAM) synthase-like enzyme
VSQIHPEHSANQPIDASQGGNVNRTDINVNLGGHTLIMMGIMTLIIGACGLVMGLNLAKQSQMDRDFHDAQVQEKLTERRLIDIESYAMLNGWKVPADDAHGPTGNLQRMLPKESQNGRR